MEFQSSTDNCTSKQEIALCHGQANCGLAGEQQAISAHGVGLRINLHLGRVIVVDHVLLFDAANVFGGCNALLQAEALGDALRDGAL